MMNTISALGLTYLHRPYFQNLSFAAGTAVAVCLLCSRDHQLSWSGIEAPEGVVADSCFAEMELWLTIELSSYSRWRQTHAGRR